LLSPPKKGLLSWCMDVLYSTSVKDIYAIPITLNYDRIFEDTNFPLELLGRPKKVESVQRLVQAMSALPNSVGTVYIHISDPISLRSCLIREISSSTLLLPSSLKEGEISLWNGKFPSHSTLSTKPLKSFLTATSPLPVLEAVKAKSVDFGFIKEQKETSYNQERLLEYKEIQQADPLQKKKGVENLWNEDLFNKRDLKTPVHPLREVYLHPGPKTISEKCISNTNKLLQWKLCSSETKIKAVDFAAHWILSELSAGILVTPTSLVATLLLMHREEGLHLQILIQKFEWLCNEILLHGGMLVPICLSSLKDFSQAVEKTLYLLEKYIQRLSHDWIQPFLTDENEKISLLLLAFYRNQLFHVFVKDSIIAIALQSFGYSMAGYEDILREDILTEGFFLWTLLHESVFFHKESPLEVLQEILDSHVDKKTIVYRNNGYHINPLQKQRLSLYNSLLSPILESFWIMGNVLLSSFILLDLDKEKMA
ncbi:naD-binding domain 4 domain-containing protein, partial [Cardiosporidium cionae]